MDTSFTVQWLGGYGAGQNNIWYYSLDDNTFTDTTNKLPDPVDVSAQAFTQMDRLIFFANENSTGWQSLQKFDMATGLVDLQWDLNANNVYPIQNRDSPCLANDGRYIFVISGTAGIHAGLYVTISIQSISSYLLA